MEFTTHSSSDIRLGVRRVEGKYRVTKQIPVLTAVENNAYIWSGFKKP